MSDEPTVKEINAHPPDPDVIKTIEALLERAKTGQMQTFAYVGVKDGTITCNGWAGMGSANMAVVGELEALKIDIMRYFVDQRIEYVESYRE